eukprot:TRINITY_DN3758_c0_g1_i1.p1 TRINITY_DN3758_c0_g1~~TRINITY_DN3758_c0_g1_i1.p1  ORF type:complete len:227 (-),score=39.12 TRINITY_DN3758_c0_g1_i1:584-1264(-)
MNSSSTPTPSALWSSNNNNNNNGTESATVLSMEHQLEMSGAGMAMLSWICIISVIQMYGGKRATRFTTLLVAGNYTLATVLFWVVPPDVCMQAVFPNVAYAESGIYFFQFIVGTFSAWIISPLYRKYHDSGYFTVVDRMRDMIRRRARFLVLVLGSFFMMPIVLLIGGGYSAANYYGFLQGIIAGYGVFWFAIVGGYGLISLPRLTWKFSKPRFVTARLFGLCDRM